MLAGRPVTNALASKIHLSIRGDKSGSITVTELEQFAKRLAVKIIEKHAAQVLFCRSCRKRAVV